MVAARVSLNLRTTHRAEAYVKLLLGCPLTELLFHVRLTATQVPMPGLSAPKANPIAALRAL